MDLRPELLPPPVTERRLRTLADEIERIEDLLFSEDLAEADAAIAAFNAATGHAYGPTDLTGYAGWRDLEDFALEAARPAYPRLSDITREELVEVVRKILDGDPEHSYHLLVLETNVTHPQAYDLLYHPPQDLEDASPERIVDEILAYRPIAL
ncbi:bacteriocin immunity protein [Streptomyces sp. R41]|uniref:Bacteriocin immunity protein n=1 Tax=Streptomyces sp. R41 TaxID=3238632 RepID=A0AB39R4M4_9ACTN